MVTCVSLGQMWHQAYRNFRETTIFMVTGLELFQKTKYDDAFAVLALISDIRKIELSLQLPCRSFNSYEFSVAYSIYFQSIFHLQQLRNVEMSPAEGSSLQSVLLAL